jgi:hypothetical protein
MNMPIEFHKWQCYRFERGTRYYTLALRQNLWGEWEIERINGRIQTSLGKARYEPCENYEAGKKLLKKYRAYRVLKRHYQELSNGYYC